MQRSFHSALFSSQAICHAWRMDCPASSARPAASLMLAPTCKALKETSRSSVRSACCKARSM